jgi:hypothetical protein
MRRGENPGVGVQGTVIHLGLEDKLCGLVFTSTLQAKFIHTHMYLWYICVIELPTRCGRNAFTHICR